MDAPGSNGVHVRKNVKSYILTQCITQGPVKGSWDVNELSETQRLQLTFIKDLVEHY